MATSKKNHAQTPARAMLPSNTLPQANRAMKPEFAMMRLPRDFSGKPDSAANPHPSAL